jgi:hypothetical protein
MLHVCFWRLDDDDDDEDLEEAPWEEPMADVMTGNPRQQPPPSAPPS